MITSIQIDSRKWADNEAKKPRVEGSLSGIPVGDVGYLILNLDHIKSIEVSTVTTGSAITVIWTDETAMPSVFHTDDITTTVHNRLVGNMVGS